MRIAATLINTARVNTALIRGVALLVSVAAGASAAAQQPPPQSPQEQRPQEQRPQEQRPQEQRPPGQKPAQPPTTQSPTTPAPTSPAPAAPQVGRVIQGDAGVFFFPVKPEKVADFEKIMAKLKEALTTAEDPVRKEQAAGWKVFKAVEPGPNNSTLYVFLIDPAVKGTDYAFWKTMYDAFPKEVQELYRLYTAASAGGQSMLTLQLLQDFKTPE
jgi:hypothetical protein